MTSLLATESLPVVDEIRSVTLSDCNFTYHKKRHRKHVLKSKENRNKHKCLKALKRKLKKYRLREDGLEDQDVLDVSRILVSSLTINSPHNTIVTSNENELSDFEDIKPKNYLFKMVKKKVALKINEGAQNMNTEISEQSSISSQEKKQKQTNAFQLLMDSRNKSIGCNSPGKEKNDDSDIQEVVEKRNIKAKRQILLQKMAEAKGSIKNKQLEEQQDLIIKEKMDKRAEKLKNMIFKDVKENEVSNVKCAINADGKNGTSKSKLEKLHNNHKPKKTLKIVDIFNSIESPLSTSPEKKLLRKEDKDFLSKLSPSLKKKESMLCYFKKLDKESPDSSPVDSENHIIKVKLQPRSKKKGRKKKLSLKRDTADSNSDGEVIADKNDQINKDKNKVIHEKVLLNGEGKKSNDNQFAESGLVEVSYDNMINESLEVKSERHKRKRDYKLKKTGVVSNGNFSNNEGRPRRSVKRPVKYGDDASLSSSDEELHIFTPKKKKHGESGPSDKKVVDIKPKQLFDEPIKTNSEKKLLNNINPTKKPAKLAPIFASKQSDSAVLEAKQKFLQSGVPEKLKRIINQQKNIDTSSIGFPVVYHVQQLEKVQQTSGLCVALIDINEEAFTITEHDNNVFNKLLNLNSKVWCHNIDTHLIKSAQIMLQSIKQQYPKFPVYRTYKYLKAKGSGEYKDYSFVDIDNSIEIMDDVSEVLNNSPDRLNWTDKYKAMSTNHIIGNFESVKELRKWLISWTENEIKTKSKSKPGSDSSDYYQSDTDSRDSMKSLNNLLVVTGPTGCGKTASVYTVAAELSMKVIEVNASSRRTGKIMLQDLQEATQSHKVNRGTGNSDNSQKSQESKQPDLIKKIKKRGRPKKNSNDDTEISKKQNVKAKTEVLSGSASSQENIRTDSSLILIDDADIVFDQDDGFTSAIVQLVQCSKRPVIVITSSLVCPHLQRFLQNSKILKMSPLSPRILGTWLDIMCLADSGTCWPGTGAKFLNYFKGDIRKTINYLQFWLPNYVNGSTSHEEIISQNVDFCKTNIDEESSCMSWANNDDSEGRQLVSSECLDINFDQNIIWSDFINKHFNLNKSYPMELFNVWWSIPSLLNPIHEGNIITKINEIPSKKTQSLEYKQELEAFANAIDAISFSDYISSGNPNSNTNITSKPWFYPEGHSVSERENFDYYQKEYDITNEICQTLVTSSISKAQHVLGCDKITDLQFPGMTAQREREKVVSRHKNLSSFLNPSTMLDRRALALDYWSSCRTICRFEKSKNDNNLKRNNRFCHYLKSLSVLCKTDTFDKLCDSLCSNEKLNET